MGGGLPRPVPNEAALSVPQPLRPEDEAERLARLNRMKGWAAFLLVAATNLSMRSGSNV